MARRKRSSKTVEQSERRIAGLKSIDANLDLGNGLNVKAYRQLIDKSRRDLEAYNTALSVVDKAYNQALNTEQSLKEFSERMLIAVAYKYGKNSDEYEMSGGSRRRERRRSRRVNEETTETVIVGEEVGNSVNGSVVNN